jgi:ribosome-binding protein aMBF1 (putative translation factor)
MYFNIGHLGVKQNYATILHTERTENLSLQKQDLAQRLHLHAIDND